MYVSTVTEARNGTGGKYGKKLLQSCCTFVKALFVERDCCGNLGFKGNLSGSISTSNAKVPENLHASMKGIIRAVHTRTLKQQDHRFTRDAVTNLVQVDLVPTEPF